MSAPEAVITDGEPGPGARPRGDVLLRVAGLTKHFPIVRGLFGRPQGWRRAVDGVDLEIRRGETLGLVGESGSGKTTLGRCILRLIEPTAGRVEFEGVDLLSLPAGRMRRMRRELQIIFQDPYGALNPRMTVGAIVAEPLVIHRLVSRRERPERVARLLEMVGLDPACRDRHPHEFSGGQRQRIGIARALALSPKLIIADEPVSALDVSVQAQILNLLVEMQERLALTYLFIAHDLSVVEHISDRVAVMYMGRIVELADSADLYRNPLHPYTRALMAAVPVADPDLRHPRALLPGEPPSGVGAVAGCAFQGRCALVQDRCRTETPPLADFGDGHLSACHRVEVGPAGPRLPEAPPDRSVASA
jgi:peptide/nickel transport system ATP-binding protein